MDPVKRIDGGEQLLPLYQCHKRVRACKVKAITYDDKHGDFTVHPEEAEDGTPLMPFLVPKAFINKHGPKPGWWVVQYEGGYLSASPDREFSNGYTLVTELQRRRDDLERQLDHVNDAIEAAQRHAEHNPGA